jgi:secondary thiamine-phosphate synthase enzyme
MICRYVICFSFVDCVAVADDGQAHIKSALVGASVNIPITNGRLATGTWQGIWYLEFRTSRHTRKVVATIQGEKA